LGGIDCTVTCDTAGTGAILVKDVNGRTLDSFTITCVAACAPGGDSSSVSAADGQSCLTVPEFSLPFAAVLATGIVLLLVIRLRFNPGLRNGT
jgi:hypothetical protein